MLPDSGEVSGEPNPNYALGRRSKQVDDAPNSWLTLPFSLFYPVQFRPFSYLHTSVPTRTGKPQTVVETVVECWLLSASVVRFAN